MTHLLLKMLGPGLVAVAALSTSCHRAEFSTLLERAEAEKMKRPCSRPFPDDLDGWWQPTMNDVARAERKLPDAIDAAYRRLSPEARDGRPDRYYGQYAGFLRDGKRVLYVNTIGRYSNEERIWERESRGWRERFINICDGGPTTFGAVFDLEKDEFDSFMFNGSMAGRMPGGGW